MRAVETLRRNESSGSVVRVRLFLGGSRSDQLGSAVPCRVQPVLDDVCSASDLRRRFRFDVERRRERRRRVDRDCDVLMVREGWTGAAPDIRRSRAMGQEIESGGASVGHFSDPRSLSSLGHGYGIGRPVSLSSRRSATRRRALRARGLASTSASDASMGVRVCSFHGATRLPYRSRRGVPSKLP